MGCLEASLMAKIGFGLSISALFFDIIGFSTPHWISGPNQYFGLFEICVLKGEDYECSSGKVDFGWQHAGRALNVIGFLLGVASVVFVTVYVFVKNEMKLLQLLGLISAFIAALLIIVGTAVFAGKSVAEAEKHFNASASWSCGLTIVGALLFLATGVVLALDKMMG